jgi:hypothetical protein
MLHAFAWWLVYQPSEVYRGARAAANRPVWGSRAGGAVMVTIPAFLYAIAQLAVWVGCIIAWVRSPEPSVEELERSEMRSSSWPSA